MTTFVLTVEVAGTISEFHNVECRANKIIVSPLTTTSTFSLVGLTSIRRLGISVIDSLSTFHALSVRSTRKVKVAMFSTFSSFSAVALRPSANEQLTGAYLPSGPSLSGVYDDD